MTAMTRRDLIGSGAGLTAAALLRGTAAAAGPGDAAPAGEHRLWFAAPATRPIDGLPVGNGRMGALLLGDPRDERILLNDDSFWSGQPQGVVVPEGRALLPRIRAAVFARDYGRADALCRELQGAFTHSYAPLAELRLGLDYAGETGDYARALDLDEAVASVAFSAGGTRFRRELLASHPAGLILLRLTAEGGPATFDAALALATPVRGHATAAGRRLTLVAKAPTRALPNYYEALIGPTLDPVVYAEAAGAGMYGAAVLEIVATDGRIAAEDDRLTVAGARELVLAVSTATGFRGYDRAPDLPAADVVAAAVARLDAARGQSWGALRAAHVADHRALYRRATLALGAAAPSAAPTDARLAAAASDPALSALLFHFGRYLLIAASRPGSQAANLQGIWSWNVRPPWSANYTTNINVQENYWPAHVCNLAELAEPYFDLIAGIAANGATTAAGTYGLPGWCCHHNSDIWRLTSPVGEHRGQPKWANFALAGPWLARSLWEHWRYGGDRDFLRTRAWPLMKGCATFCAAWLVEAPGSARLTTAPSVSTENSFIGPDGRQHEVSAGCTLDIAMIREMLTTAADAADLLGVDHLLAAEWRAKAARLIPYTIGAHGQLQEWSEDFLEAEPEQRHLSHLYPVYPGSEITPRSRPELAKAAEVSLDRRIAAKGGPIGWSETWKVALFGRLAKAEKAVAQLHRFLSVSANGNLFSIMNKGPGAIFQIDGNYAASAAIAELLLQSHEGEIALLPALPAAWSDGAVTGLRARGGLTLDARWSGGVLRAASVTADRTGTHRFRAPGRQRIGGLKRADGRFVRATLLADGSARLRLPAGEACSLVLA